MFEFKRAGRALLMSFIVALTVTACGGGGGGGGTSGSSGSSGSGGTSSTATLLSITVTPATPTIAAGATQQMKATGYYSDNTSKDITASVIWGSGTPAIATIGISSGLVSGVTAGSTLITANSGSITGNTTLTVTTATGATVKSISVSPVNPTINTGGTQQMAAVALYSDNTTQTLTTSVYWTSGNAAVANVGASTGLVSGVSAGSSVITATWGSGTGALSGNTTVTVQNAATLVSIAVTPVNPSLAVNTTLQMKATGTYSDNSTQDLTNSVTWTSANTSVATVVAATGLVSGVALGNSVITATYGSGTSAVSGNTTVTVGSATLVSIAVTPASPTITLGATQPMTATGTYSDNSTQDLTSLVSWSSGTTSVATIGASTGLLGAVGAGNSVITATLNGVSGNTTVTVSATGSLNEIFVANQIGPSQILVYPRTASGSPAPQQNITGAATGLDFPEALYVDRVNNEIVVANSSAKNSTTGGPTGTYSITVYAITATGNVAPLRTISGTSTGLCAPYGVAVDTVNNEILVANSNLIGGCTASITVYSRTANGNVAPLRTISGTSTLLVNPSGLSVDTTNNEIFVAEGGAANAMLVFGRTASGNVAPLRNISGSSTLLNIPAAAQVDLANSEAFVTSYGTSSVEVFGRAQTGNVAPTRTVVGAATGIDNPFNTSVDDVNNEIGVSNNGVNGAGASITFYSRTANGNVAPLRTLTGYANATGTVLQAPSWVQIEP